MLKYIIVSGQDNPLTLEEPSNLLGCSTGRLGIPGRPGILEKPVRKQLKVRLVILISGMWQMRLKMVGGGVPLTRASATVLTSSEVWMVN